jgi:hypothetical protein
MAWTSLDQNREELSMSKDKNDEVITHGAVTEYRPHKDDVSGGSDKSVQSEATGAEGASDLNTAGSTSGGAAGRITSLEHNQPPRRDGGLSADDEPQPAGDRGNLTR